jgi:hypothetical protein
VKHSPVKGLEYAPAALFKRAHASNTAVDGTIVREEALHIAVCLGVHNFTASSGWINRYKNRHNTVYKTVTLHCDNTVKTLFPIYIYVPHCVYSINVQIFML